MQEAVKSHSFSNQLNRGFTLSPCSHIILGSLREESTAQIIVSTQREFDAIYGNFRFYFVFSKHKYFYKKINCVKLKTIHAVLQWTDAFLHILIFAKRKNVHSSTKIAKMVSVLKSVKIEKTSGIQFFNLQKCRHV